MTTTTRAERHKGQLFGKDRTVACGVTLNLRDGHLMSVAIDDAAQWLPDGEYILKVGSEELGEWHRWRRQSGVWKRM
jgi:hypothetical protein